MSFSPPNARRQRPSETKAILRPPRKSSSDVKLRPSAGWTPRVSIKLDVTVAVFTRIGSPDVVRLPPPVVHAPTLSHEFASFLMSRNSGGDIQNFFSPIVGNSV